jgi:hypothetical protein
MMTQLIPSDCHPLFVILPGVLSILSRKPKSIMFSKSTLKGLQFGDV